VAEIEANPRFKARAATGATGATGEFGGGNGTAGGAGKPEAEMSVEELRAKLYPKK
jgi:hypothetical protein